MFKNQKRFDIRRAMSWVDMPELGPKARVLVKPATEANPGYYNAMLAMSGKRVRQMVRSDKITAEDAALNRDDDRKLYPRYVLAGFDCVEGDPETAQEGELDAEGHVIFTRNSATKLCEILHDHLMDRLRNHAATPERFYGEDSEAPPDAEELAGNSSGDSGGS